MSSRTPLSDEALERLPQFVTLLSERLTAGKRVYGDTSFMRPLALIADELAQEALDLAGWGFILWSRVEKLRALALEATTPRRPTTDAPIAGSARCDDSWGV